MSFFSKKTKDFFLTFVLPAVCTVLVLSGGLMLQGLADKAHARAQEQERQDRLHYQAHQAPVENKQFSQITAPSEGSIKVYIDDQLGIVCISDSSRLACVPQQDIKPEGLAFLRDRAKLQLERAAIAAAKKVAAKNGEYARPRTSH